MTVFVEAVRNSVYAIDDRFGADTAKGEIVIQLSGLSGSRDIEIDINDNGIGSDARRYEAFCQVDTDFKRAKGVGRLFWLGAFRQILAESVHPSRHDDLASIVRRAAIFRYLPGDVSPAATSVATILRGSAPGDPWRVCKSSFDQCSHTFRPAQTAGVGPALNLVNQFVRRAKGQHRIFPRGGPPDFGTGIAFRSLAPHGFHSDLHRNWVVPKVISVNDL